MTTDELIQENEEQLERLRENVDRILQALEPKEGEDADGN